MRLCKASELPATASAVFRESASGKGAAFALFSALFVAFVVGGAEVGGRDAGLPLLVVCVLGAATFLLLAALSFASLRATRRPSSWVLRVQPDGLSVKFRSYLNHHFPAEDPIVVHLPHGEVSWVRKTREKRVVPHEDHEVHESWTCLDLGIRLEPTEAARLADALRAERARRAPRIGFSRTKHHHYPVRLVDGGTFRIDWKGPSTSVTPGIDSALEVLRAFLPVEPEARLEGQPTSRLDRQEAEDRILELAEQGRVTAAVNLARRTYGYGLREARDFVEGLVRG